MHDGRKHGIEICEVKSSTSQGTSGAVEPKEKKTHAT
jgi:hypothetical protein